MTQNKGDDILRGRWLCDSIVFDSQDIMATRNRNQKAKGALDKLLSKTTALNLRLQEAHSVDAEKLLMRMAKLAKRAVILKKTCLNMVMITGQISR